MLKKYGNFTNPLIDINVLINQIQNKEIEFSTVEKLADDNQISASDFSQIFLATHNPLQDCNNYGCPL